MTPLTDDVARSVGHGILYILVVRYRELGVAGFMACGSIDEATALINQEQANMFNTVRAAADGLPMMMGVSSSVLASVRGRMLRLVEHRSAAFLIPMSFYIWPSQDGITEYFTALVDASPVPAFLCDIPYRAGADIDTKTLLALVVHPSIHGTKDCGGDTDKTQRLATDRQLQVLARGDAQVFGMLCAGGAGMITAATYVRTELFVEMIRAVQERRLSNARRLHRALVPVIRLLFARTNPGPLKA